MYKAFGSVVVCAFIGEAACGGSGRRLDVFAAASLAAPFGALETAFEASHPGLDVVVNLAGSQVLRAQIEGGAPCDVVATADDTTMDALVKELYAEPARAFATSHLVVVAPASNPAGLASWDDLANVRTIALGADEAPIGRYARQLLLKVGRARGPSFESQVLTHVTHFELDAPEVIARVARRDVDAAIVTATDAQAAGARVLTFAIPAAFAIQVRYPIARTTKGPSPELATEFIALVASPEGQAILAKAGFQP